MSAIWGIIQKNESSTISQSKDSVLLCSLEESENLLQKKYSPYAIDRYDSCGYKNAVFGCGIQNLTPLLTAEKLPFYDKAANRLVTIDCVLDNREELKNLLKDEIAKSDDHAPTDARLLYMSFCKWGNTFYAYVCGAFAMVIYDGNSDTVELFTDHMNNRSLFWTIMGNRLYFSTLLAPLASLVNASPDEKWCAGCLCNTSADMILFEEITPYKGIFQVMAGTKLTFLLSEKNDQPLATSLWSPLSYKPNLKCNSVKEYRDTFVNILQTAVCEQMAGFDKVGCTLSSGLDSTSIAALAAKKLHESTKELFSYTSVPLPDFPTPTDPFLVADERPGVEVLREMYPNIVPHYIACEGKDAFSSLSYLVPLLGYPMKSGMNLTWLNEIYSSASMDGCSGMLKGQFGNSTISYGPALGTIHQLLFGGHPLKACKVINGFGKRNRIARKRIIKSLITEELSRRKASPADSECDALPNEIYEKYQIRHVLNSLQTSMGGGQLDTRSQRLHFLWEQSILSQLGMFDTAMGLIHHVIIRDPSKDKRVVELCCRIPVEYDLAGYLERGKIRTFMEGLVPEKILKDVNHRGMQSADYNFRCQKLWLEERNHILSTIKGTDFSGFVRSEYVEDVLKDSENPETYIPLNVLYSFALFLKNCSN